MAGMLDLSTLDPNFLAGMLKGGPGAVAPTAPVAAAPATGGVLDGLFTPKAAQPITNGDRWNILGATLKDIGDGLRGGEGGNLAKTQQAIAATGRGAPSGAAAASGKGAKKAPGQPTDTALLYQTAQNLFPGDPKAQFLFATGNEDFLKSLSEGYGFHEVTGGNSAFGLPGQPGPYVAPKLVDHDGVYGTQGANGYQGTGAAMPSNADLVAQQNADTEGQKAADLAAHYQRDDTTQAKNAVTNAGRLGVDLGNLNLNRSRLSFDVRKDSAGRSPGTVYVQSQADIDALPPGSSFISVHDPYGIVRHK